MAAPCGAGICRPRSRIAQSAGHHPRRNPATTTPATPASATAPTHPVIRRLRSPDRAAPRTDLPPDEGDRGLGGIDDIGPDRS
jgi:hypothetical protein